jgi:hypothetical protein
MCLDQSGALELVQSAIDKGQLDEALRQLATAALKSDDARAFAYLLCQRGDYGRAVEVLRDERWSEAIGPGGLRLRGNSLWRAGHLNEALQDLNAAEKVATGEPETAAIRTDIVLLREEVGVMNRVDRSLTRLEIAFAITVGLLVIAIVEVHRRAIARGSPAR